MIEISQYEQAIEVVEMNELFAQERAAAEVYRGNTPESEAEVTEKGMLYSIALRLGFPEYYIAENGKRFADIQRATTLKKFRKSMEGLSNALQTQVFVLNYEKDDEVLEAKLQVAAVLIILASFIETPQGLLDQEDEINEYVSMSIQDAMSVFDILLSTPDLIETVGVEKHAEFWALYEEFSECFLDEGDVDEVEDPDQADS